MRSDDLKNNLEAGTANGSQLLVDKVVLNNGEMPFQIMIDGVVCNDVRASAIKHLIVKLKAAKKENVKRFYVTTEEKKLKATYPIPDYSERV